MTWTRFALLACLLLSLRAQADKCDICRGVATKFKEEFERTKTKNFGGGNTDWEERTLGSYATSETRFLDIIEHVCEHKDYECQQFIEEKEDLLEKFWKELTAKSTLNFFESICIKKTKFCCSENRVGKDCKPCPGGTKNPCGGHGACLGAGSRSGQGTCSCHEGYHGPTCSECASGFFKNATDNSCVRCHSSCMECTSESKRACTTCAIGFSKKNGYCLDVDECAQLKDGQLCGHGKYCVNKEGSYDCLPCDKVCDGCTSAGRSKCINCNSGYRKRENTKECIDIDECLEGSLQCPIGQYCQNRPGTASCAPCDESCDDNGCTRAGSSGCVSCGPGYRRDPALSIMDSPCQDIDECAENGCREGFTCTNTKGSFTCKCERPSMLTADGDCVNPNAAKTDSKTHTEL